MALDPQEAELSSMQHELRIMSQLDHPNVIKVYGGCLRPPNLFVVEELMERDLASSIHRRGEGEPPLPLSAALKTALDIAKGLVRFPVASHTISSLSPPSSLLVPSEI